jgi:uncharacterized protein YabE (DUF348 family)
MRKKIARAKFRIDRFRLVRLPRHINRIQKATKNPHSVPVYTFAFLILLTSFIYAIARQTNTLPVTKNSIFVIVVHDRIQQTIPTHEKTVAGLIAKMGLKLNQGDVIEPALTTKIDQDQFRINIYRALPVEIVDGSTRLFTFSAATTPRAIAAQSGSKVYPEDNVTIVPSLDFISYSSIGEQIVIDRATPISLNLYGSIFNIRTHATTISDLIKQKSIVLAADDQITPSLNTPLVSNQQIVISRHGTKIESVTETIPMPVQTILDSSLAYGTSAVRQYGSAGIKVTTYQLDLSNGGIVGRTVVQTVITQPAVTQIVVSGSSLSGIKGDMALAGISPADYYYVDYIISHESGWCPTKPQGTYGVCPPYAGYVPDYGGYGLCQSTPGIKMASAGADWATNPITQLEWCSGYAQSRYGSWQAAYEHWRNYYWW